ncbi:MAG: hypothetical protein Q4G23_03015, partial [Clostridia bacterium]|nr:hypothetical protein [Clostridia bacterium]
MGKRKTVSLNKVLTDPLYDIMDAVQKAAKTVAETTYATAGKTALAKQSKVGTTKVQTSKKQSTGKDADLKDTGKALSTAVVAGAKAAGEKMLFEGLKERKKKEEKAKTGYPEERNARSGTVKRGVGAGGSNQWERSYSDVFKAPVTYG